RAAALPPAHKPPRRFIPTRAPGMLPIPGAREAAGEAAGNADATVGMAAPKAAARPGAGAAAADGGDRLGRTMPALSDDERRSTGLAVGMMVDAVHGPAAKAGIQPGDVVLELNDTLLETPDDIPTLEANGSVIAVLIQRNNARRFVSVHAR
ncbi:PDZ domain-containing protein, partial [Burkholderia contaminans]|uniref:PDZ domain-containing protein n=1 Tax=Burkholderia contaminans TaxID=488447 RepID=UPI001C9698DF